MQQPTGDFDSVRETNPIWRRIETERVVRNRRFLSD
jgi:hypothetical protein